ncbi:hypothetical protein ACFQHO_36805 [Actinomadura yumaensis]|uniref:hypothetical protein n=1 Tax=Actinomadura yumaensis TaxID=111807 RepID=UPI00360CA6CF
MDSSATVARIDSDELVVDTRARGSVLLRIAYSPWLSVRDARGERQGCLAAEGDFVRMNVPGPGRYHIGARYGLPRGTPCEG